MSNFCVHSTWQPIAESVSRVRPSAPEGEVTLTMTPLRRVRIHLVCRSRRLRAVTSQGVAQRAGRRTINKNNSHSAAQRLVNIPDTRHMGDVYVLRFLHSECPPRARVALRDVSHLARRREVGCSAPTSEPSLGRCRLSPACPRVENARFQLLESTVLSSRWLQISTCTPTPRYAKDGGAICTILLSSARRSWPGVRVPGRSQGARRACGSDTFGVGRARDVLRCKGETLNPGGRHARSPPLHARGKAEQVDIS